jgi:alanyl-tRNA synthetase
VEFVCGGRAAADLRRKTGVLSRVSAGLSVGLDELEAAVARARESEQTSRKRLDDAMERLAAFEAAELLAAAPRAGGIAIVRQAYRDRTAQDLRLLAAAISERGGVALLGLEAGKGQVLFASPPGSTVDCGRLLRECVAAVGGKGGGQPNLAQGGMPEPAKVQQVLAAALEKITGGS